MKLVYLLFTLCQSSLIAARCMPTQVAGGPDCSPPKTSTSSKTTMSIACTDKGVINLAIAQDKQAGKLQITNKDTGPRAFTVVFILKGGMADGKISRQSYYLASGETCDEFIDDQAKYLHRAFTTGAAFRIGVPPVKGQK